VRTADADGATIDRQGAEDLTFTALVGASGDTLSGSVYVLLEVEHSDDGSTWADCANADLTNTVTGATTGTFAKIDDPAEDDAVFKVGYIGGKRYVRVVQNLVGTHTNGIPIGVVASLAMDVVTVN
jgi:hypothetical protein